MVRAMRCLLCFFNLQSPSMSGYLFSQKKARIRIALVLIAVVTAISFLSSLDNDFTNWDDDEYVTENYVIRNLSWITLKTIFTSFYTDIYYCPLVILSYTLEYALFGLAPFGDHLTYLLLHMGNPLLVFALVLRLSTHLLPALVAALLFGVHPLHVESVAWVTERKDMLSTLFFLGSVLLYLRYQQDRQARFYALSLVTFVLSLLSKPMGITLPFILFLCDYLCARAWTPRTLVEKVPFVMVSALFSVVTVLSLQSSGNINAARFSALGDNVLVACWGLAFYLGKTLAPVGLSALYPYPPEISLRLPAFFLPPILLLALAAGVWISRRYTRAVVFGSLFFFITLLPLLRIIPIRGAVTADHFMYIPSIGLFYLAGVAFQRVYTWKTRWEGAKKVFLRAVLSLTILTLSVLTWQRCNVWQDSETLWLNVLEAHPEVPIVHNNLGAAYGRKGLLEEAIVEYEKALALDPKYVLAHNNLGFAYGRKGLLEEAIVEYKKALALDPKSVIARNNLGNVYGMKGLLEEAITEFKKALAVAPDYPLAHNNLGYTYLIQGKLETAITEFHKALAIDPIYARAHYNLALAYFYKGSYREAIEHYDRARKLGYSGDPSLAEALAPHRQAQ